LNEFVHLPANSARPFVSIRGNFNDFLKIYESFLEKIEQKPNSSDKEKIKKYNQDIYHKLSLMITLLQSILGIKLGINKQITNDTRKKLELLLPQITGIIEFLKPQQEFYLQKMSS